MLVLRWLSQQPRSRVRLKFRVRARKSLELPLLWLGRAAAKGWERLQWFLPQLLFPRLQLIPSQGVGLAQGWEWGQTSPLQGPFAAALAAASPPITHRAAPAPPCPAPSSFLWKCCWKCLVILLGNGLEGSGAELHEKATSWGDKNTFQGETKALFGLTSYPLQDDQSHNKML